MKNDVDSRVTERLTNIIIAGCTCMVKTPVIQHHNSYCHYRLASEIEQLLIFGELIKEENNET